MWTRIEPWQGEDSVWKDSSLSTIIPLKRNSPNKALYPTHTVLKTNHLSNSNGVSTSLTSSQKYLSDISLHGVPSSKFADSYPSHVTSHHKSKSKLHVARKRSSKSSHHHHKRIEDVEFESAAVKVLSALQLSTNRQTSTRNLLELPDGDTRKNMIPKVVLRDIGYVLRKACPNLNVSPTNDSDKFAQSSDSPASPSPASVFLADSDSEKRESIVYDSSKTTLVDLDKDPESTVSETPLPAMSPTKIFQSINSALAVSPRKNYETLEKSALNLPSFDVLGAMAPTFTNTGAPHSFSSNASQSIKPILPFVPSFPISKTTRSVCASPPLTDSPLDERIDLPKESSPKPEPLGSIKPPANKSTCHIKFGFLGFPQEDGRKLRKTRFHVNTNILASSLDLLDLHKNIEVSTGSPYSCSFCDIVFSSVKHCKYHQSVISSEVTDVTDVQEDGFWLCPWCPIIALSSEYFSSHKEVCREKGRCHQELKASSVRKNASASSRRRSKPPTNTNNTVASPVKTNSFKVFHGQIIPVTLS